MAKGNGNSTGRQPSRNAKPYDPNNSFVKKVATKVTDFIPQSLWPSKWFNSSQGSENALDIRENPEDSELVDDTQQPPASKRPCIRMDVIHPPGTFYIQPRSKTALNAVDPSKEQYFVHNEVPDFLEPATAGPSGMGRLISSTPAMQTDIRTMTSHRSDLNSLASPTNNGTVNGTDDHSESSESTSGCSSLIPQINRHDGPSNLLYSSAFPNRKRHIDDKLTFTNHLQSPRSLFLDSNSRDSLSNRRPSFNASVMTSLLDRASPLSSPFYSGNTTFGGANAAGLYKQNRNIFNDSNELQLKVPRRMNVEVKSSHTTGVDSSGMSQTAKKILEALDHFSSPISDAKKIPLRSADNASPLMSRKRAREEIATPSARVGLRHLTRELTVPTVPDILKLRRRQRLQDTTLAARKIVSARSDPPPPSQEYQLRTEDGDREKYRRKIKGKSKINLEEEETVEPVNLPNIPLPISTLPNFNFTLPLTSHNLDKTTAKKGDNFTFASPIKVTDAGKNFQSINHFTFSNPINAEDNMSNITNDSSPASKPGNVTSNTSSINRVTTATSMPNFIWSGSSTAPRLKEKAKSSNDGLVPAVVSERKPVSVLDILRSMSNKTESNLITQSNSGLTPKTTYTDKTSGMITPDSDIKTVADAESCGSTNDSTKSPSDWECSECLIRNNGSDEQCTACKAVRSNTNEKVSPCSSTIESIEKTKPVVNDCFGSQFKLSTNQWECGSCYVRSKQSDIKCIACSTPKLEDMSATHQTVSSSVKSKNFDLMEKFKPAEGSWECPGCLLRNAANVIICPCCNTCKPTSIKTGSRKTATIADLSTQKSTSIDTEKMGTQAIESNNSEIMNKFKPSKDSWECPGCLVRNKSSIANCPCCSTAKPTSAEDTSRTQQTSANNGFGDKFKKPEGAWNCDSCLLQNDAKYTKCVACETVKPGETVTPNETASNTNSTLQFKFGIAPNTSGFKFGIDKADEQSKSNNASLNGFKFGNAQQDNNASQCIFVIPKEENKAVNETKNVATSSNSTGFQFNVKSSEKSVTKLDQEIKQDTPFSIPKSDSLTKTNEKQSTSTVASTNSTSILSFSFGTQKAGFNQPVSNKEVPTSFVTTVTESSKPTAASDSTPNTTSTTLPSLLMQNYKSQSDTKATYLFSFGAPSTNVASSNASTSATTTTCLPTFAQSFAFPDSKAVQQTATVPTFGQIPTSSTNLSFGGNKTNESTSTLPSDKSAVSDKPIFPIVSSSTPLFNSSEKKTPVKFGADKPPAFTSAGNKQSGFAIPENKIPAFSSNIESKPTIFGTPETKLPVFGSDEKTALVFNSGQTSTVNPVSTFGAPSSATSSFGSSSGPAFGNNAGTPAFGAATSTIFPSSTKPNESNTSANPASLFTFGSNQSTQQSTGGGGFNFSANTNPAESTQKQQLFTFGSNSSTPQSNTIFGGSSFAANPVSTNTTNFTFNASKQEIPAFAQNAVAPSMFGANPQTQATSSFSSTPSSSTGFNFGSTAPSSVTPSGGFNFGGMSSISASTGGFNFNPPTSTPAVTFDPNSRPSFNFTKGSAPTAFNAPPQSAAAAAPRKIKKAFRRCVR